MSGLCFLITQPIDSGTTKKYELYLDVSGFESQLLHLLAIWYQDTWPSVVFIFSALIMN